MNIVNSRAGFNYDLLDRYEAGIVLNGLEVKAIQKGDVDLTRSFVRFLDHEAYLVNAGIGVHATQMTDSRRSRKLLLHRRELVSLTGKLGSGHLTLIPVRLYNKGRRFKLEFALARSKHEFEKRDIIKKREVDREIARNFKA
jgi:SsrA-binding protein